MKTIKLFFKALWHESIEVFMTMFIVGVFLGLFAFVIWLVSLSDILKCVLVVATFGFFAFAVGFIFCDFIVRVLNQFKFMKWEDKNNENN